MALWGNIDRANNAPKYAVEGGKGSSASGQTAFANSTPDAIVQGTVVGVYGANTVEAANNKVSPGWVLKRARTSGVESVAVSNVGASFANGETAKLSNGSSNGVVTLTTNSTGNLTGASITSPGAGWTDSADVAVSFNREKHLANITVANGGVGYANGDVVTASNGTVDGSATVSTNSTGGITSLTLTNVGLWANTKANTDVSFSVKANTGANSAGSNGAFTANLTSSTNGGLTVTLNENAGRVQLESLVAMRSITGTGSSL